MHDEFYHTIKSLMKNTIKLLEAKILRRSGETQLYLAKKELSCMYTSFKLLNMATTRKLVQKLFVGALDDTEQIRTHIAQRDEAKFFDTLKIILPKFDGTLVWNVLDETEKKDIWATLRTLSEYARG